MGFLSEHMGLTGTVEVLPGNPNRAEVPYVDKKTGESKVFHLVEQYVVFRAISPRSGLATVQEASITLGRDDPLYQPGMYQLASGVLKISDRGRLGFGRDVVLQRISDGLLHMIEQDSKRTAAAV